MSSIQHDPKTGQSLITYLPAELGGEDKIEVRAVFTKQGELLLDNGQEKGDRNDPYWYDWSEYRIGRGEWIPTNSIYTVADIFRARDGAKDWEQRWMN